MFVIPLSSLSISRSFTLTLAHSFKIRHWSLSLLRFVAVYSMMSFLLVILPIVTSDNDAQIFTHIFRLDVMTNDSIKSWRIDVVSHIYSYIYLWFVVQTGPCELLLASPSPVFLLILVEKIENRRKKHEIPNIKNHKFTIYPAMTTSFPHCCFSFSFTILALTFMVWFTGKTLVRPRISNTDWSRTLLQLRSL